MRSAAMIKPLRTAFLVADNGRARWLSRTDAGHDLETIAEIHAEAASPSHPTGVVFESSTGRRSTIAERNDAVRERRSRFATRLAEDINHKVDHHQVERLVLVAPARMLTVMMGALSPAAKQKLAGSIAKDLTKTPNHELDTWLRPLEL